MVWAVVAVLSALTVFGFVHENLFGQEIWKPEGLERLAIFTLVFWAIAGLVLWKRPAWLLPVFAALAFGYAEWWCSQFADPIAPVVVCYFLGSCYSLGRAVKARQPLLVGLAIWIFILSIAVHFPINRGWIYLTAFGIPYIALRGKPAPPAKGNLALAGLIYIVLLHLGIVLKPEVSTDGLAMHLAIPDMIARAGKFAFDFRHYAWSVMPMGGDFAFTAVYLPGGETAARLLNFSFFVTIVLTIYSAARSYLGAALFASTPLVQLVTGSLLVENIWAALLTGGAVALMESDAIVAAILFGAAFATKVGTAAFFVPAAAIALFRNRDRKLWAALALLVLFAALPYVNAWIKTGDPIFPFANNLFHSPYFDTTTPLQDVRYQQHATWTALYDLAFHSSRFLESQNGALGFQFLLLLIPMLLLLNRKAPLVPVAIGLAGGILTFASIPNLRYLYPALALLSIGLSWMLAEVPRLVPAAIAVVALNVWFLPSSGWYHTEFALFTQDQIDDYTKFFAPERQLVNVANQIAPGQPIAMLQVPAIAGLHARAYVEAWHTPQFWRTLMDATEPVQIAQEFQKLGIRYLITPIPPESDHVIVSQFVDTWTAPTGRENGRYQLRMLLAEPVTKPKEIQPAGPGTYDDLDPRIEYTGGWLHDRQFEQSFGRSITYSNQPGDGVRFFFSGRSITYVYTMALNRGIAEVSIDRQPRGRVDLYSKETRWQQKTMYDGLEPGPHTLEIRIVSGK
jgi:hypothetical protein